MNILGPNRGVEHVSRSSEARFLKLVKARMLAAGNLYSRAPVMRIEIEGARGSLADLPPDWIDGLVTGLPIMRAWVLDFPAWAPVREGRSRAAAATVIELLAILLQRSVGWSVSFMGGPLSSEDTAHIQDKAIKKKHFLMFETRQKATGLLAGRMALDIFNKLERVPESEVGAVLSEAFQTFRRRTSHDTLGRFAIWIADRAERRGISWSALPHNSFFLRLGRGRHAEMLWGCDTSLTSCIGLYLAKRKDITRDLLAAAGLPVAEQRSARRLNTVVAAANAIGYPVVVKPRNGSQGRGVSVNLTNDGEVTTAFELAQTIAPFCVVESFIKGDTFRLTVVGGRFFAAAQRHPPRLLGDGVRTVEMLIAQENKNPERQPGAPVSMKPITLDDEMLALLSEQGADPTSVPEVGRWVLLRRVPNPPFGDKTDVTDIVHPEIRAMSERVASLMGIAVCGIDFITTDITRPTEETGGAICEVNTRPDLGMHLLVTQGTPRDGADAVLEMLYPAGKQTGFPIIAVLRENSDSAAENEVRAAWEGRGYKVGVATALDRRFKSTATSFAGQLRMLDLNTEIDLGIVALSPRQFNDWGLGCDAVDLVIIPAGDERSRSVKRARRALERLARGQAIALNDPDLTQRSFEALKLQRTLRRPMALIRPAAELAIDGVSVQPKVRSSRQLLGPSDILASRRNMMRPYIGRLKSQEPKLYNAGNLYARRPVLKVPLQNAADIFVPTQALKGLAKILPPLSRHVCDFGGWRRVITCTTPVPAAALTEILAIAAQRYVGWPVRFCAWRPQTVDAGSQARFDSSDPNYYARNAGRTANAVFEIATPGVGKAAAKIALQLASAIVDGKDVRELQSMFQDELDEFRRTNGLDKPHQDALEAAREASKRGIAWSAVEGSNFVRLGSGRFAHMIAGSETSKTSLISQRLAKSKPVTAGILASVGLPVPRHRVVKTETEALEAARAIGFPLVIKPATSSKGRAVSIEIMDDAGVVAGVRSALSIAQKAMLESYIQGDEYRLLVVDGRFAAGTLRRPAQVWGDDARTVRMLVDKENARPERDLRFYGMATSLIPLVLDDDALRLLEEQGLTPEAIPEKGRSVLLRRQSNHARSGDTVDVTDAVHSSIREMAERVAAVLKIDVCGIDFITTDITRSPNETGGAICEVNTRPGLSLHYGVSQGKARNVAGKVIDMLFPKGSPSRCPVVVLVGTQEQTVGLRRAAAKAATSAKRCLSIVGMSTDPHALRPGLRQLKDVGALAWDKDTEAVIVQASAIEVAEQGLGLERIDLAILPDDVGDPSIVLAEQVLARLSGDRIIRLGDRSARKQMLAALGFFATKQGGRRPLTAPKTVREKSKALSTTDFGEQPAALSEGPRAKDADVTVLIVGDIGFGEAYLHRPRTEGLQQNLDRYGYRHSVANLEGLVRSADLVVGNLEVPLAAHSDTALRGRKKYLGWSDPERTVEALREAKVKAVSLANNHSLDCGVNGLEETIDRLKAAGIASFGAGRDLTEAEQPLIQKLILNGKQRSLVFFGGFEHRARYESRYRWYARDGSAGVAGFATERIAATIAELRKVLPSPLFVAYPHWGVDYSDINDAQRALASQLIKAGVDLVIGHGSHTAQPIEVVDGRLVVFGLGNFVWNSPGRYRKLGVQPYSLAAAIVFREVQDQEQVMLRLFPIITDNSITKFQNRLVTGEEFANAAQQLSGAIEGLISHRTNETGRYLELRLDSWPGSSVGASMVHEALSA